MANFTISIGSWFRQNKRDLPWRETSNPYKIWLSEVILQQTKVEQGLNYYLKFIESYPTVKLLAEAKEDDVLNLWQGLGYYSRARNMHFSAKLIMTDFNGVFPTDYKGVLALKGVGEYTAAAITSIAYGLPHAVVDGNVYRVLSRYLAISTPIDTTTGKKEFTAAANELLDVKNPGDHNQAVMELGAMVCTPKSPKCDICPIQDGCLARAKGEQLNYPIKSKKTKVVNRFFNYLIVTNGKWVVLKKRTGKGIWQGLYDFPLVEKKEGERFSIEDLQMNEYKSCTEDGTFKHVLSHQIIQAKFWYVEVENIDCQDGEVLVSFEDLKEYPMPQLLIRYMEASRNFTAE